MTIKEHWTLRIAGLIFLGFIIGNLLFLDFIILSQRDIDKTQFATMSTREDEQYCDRENCVPEIYNAIDQATRSAKKDNVTGTVTSDTQGVKEFTISFGGGVNTTREWQDVPGVAAYIDSSKYSGIDTVTFEAGVYIPTGNQTAYVRLYNVTAQHPVWYSEVSLSGGNPQLLISQPLTLDAGNILYQVQMMSTLSYQTNLTEAKVRIKTK